MKRRAESQFLAGLRQIASHLQYLKHLLCLKIPGIQQSFVLCLLFSFQISLDLKPLLHLLGPVSVLVFVLYQWFEKDPHQFQYHTGQWLGRCNDQAIGQYDIEIGEDLSQTIDTEQKQEQKQALEDAEAVLDPNLFEKKIADIEQMIAVSQEFSNKEDASNTASEKQSASNQLGIDSPLAFSKKDRHSFSQWLELTTATPIVREEIKEEKLSHTTKEKEHKNDLIEKFINEKPKIKSLKNSPQQQNTTQEDSKPSNSLMTETLAKVYLQQKNYKKAIQAYKILILKNPEKSGFFADQIRAVEKLINTEAP